MSAPLPDALRARFQKLIEEGLSGRAAALRLKLSPATGARWRLAIRQSGTARAARQGRPKGKGKLAAHQLFLIEVVAQDGDITMPELAVALHDATGVQAHPVPLAGSCASLASHTKKDAGRHRATPCLGSLRDLHGVYHLIPFSSVDAVSNFTRDFSNYVVDMGVAYREDVDEAKQAMFDAFDELRADPEQAGSILDDLEWFGLDQFADSAIVLRARIKTLPGKQWGVGRAYNAIVKRVFDERGIEIPFPHTTLFFGENKKENTQKLRVEASDTTPAG